MDRLPAELICHLATFCDLKSLEHLAVVNKKFRNNVLDILEKQHAQELDFVVKDIGLGSCYTDVTLSIWRHSSYISRSRVTRGGYPYRLTTRTTFNLVKFVGEIVETIKKNGVGAEIFVTPVSTQNGTPDILLYFSIMMYNNILHQIAVALYERQHLSFRRISTILHVPKTT